MQSTNESLIERALHRLAESIYQHPRWYIYSQWALLAVCLFYAATRLEVRSSRSDLVSADLDYEKEWRAYKAEFPAPDDLVVLVESEDLEKNRQFVERLGARIEAETNLFRDVLYRGDIRRFGPKALQLLPVARLEAILGPIREYAPLIETFSEVTNLASLITVVDQRMRSVDPDQSSNQPLAHALVPLTRILLQAADTLHRPGVPPSTGWSALFAETPEGASRDYISLARGRIYLVACAAKEASQETQAIHRLRQLVEETVPEVPGVNAGVTGESVLRLDEVTQAKRDTTIASAIALVLVSLIFIYGYHEIARPLKATACLLVGISYTLGFATLTVGYLNILTITFVPILIGLAIDFGVHLVTRFEEELRLGCGDRIALRKALVCAGTGVFTSGLTTAAAFLAVGLTQFKGVREMGIISGGGILLCLIPMMTLLPALLLGSPEPYVAPPQPQSRRRPRRRGARREQWDRLWLTRPRRVALLGFIVTAISLSLLPGVRFDYNLLNLQSADLPAVVFEKKLMEASPKSLLHCVVMASTPEEAMRLESRLMELPTVATVDSLGRLLTEDPEDKLALVREIKRVADPIQFAPPDLRTVNLSQLSRALRSLSSFSHAAARVVGQQGNTTLATELGELAAAGQTLLQEFELAPAPLIESKLTEFQQAFFMDLAQTVAALKRQVAHEGLSVADLPAALRDRFIGRSGRFLLRVYPKEDVWDRDNQEAFVSELRSVVPGVTGSPVRFYEHTALLKRSSLAAAGYAAIAIALMVMLHFRSVAGVLLALLPVLLGLIWMLGWMSYMDIEFNPANIMSITLVIGIGVTNGIHILNRFREEKHASILAKSTGKAVVVSALTTMTGFGSLMLAEHEGIASLGEIMAIGTGMCMLAALTVLPAALTLLSRYGWKLRMH